jgi:hypothetical protein
MAKYTVGAKVIMSPVGINKYSLQSEGSAGTIQRATENGSYSISWENGHTNGYHDEDLLPFPKILTGYIIKTNCNDRCVLKGSTFLCRGAHIAEPRRVTHVRTHLRYTVVASDFLSAALRKDHPKSGSEHACPIGLCTVVHAMANIQLELFEDLRPPKEKEKPKSAVLERRCHHCGGAIPSNQEAMLATLRDGTRVMFYDSESAREWFGRFDPTWRDSAEMVMEEQ